MCNPRQLLRHTSGLITAMALLLPCLNAAASLPTARPNPRMSDVEYSMSNVGRNVEYSMSNVECSMLAVASGLLTAETHAIDHLGNVTASRTFIDRDYKTVFHLTTTPASTQASGTITVNGLLEESTSTSGHTPPTTPPITSITPFAPTYDQ